MLSNCDAREGSWESPGQQGDQTSQSYRKSTLNIHWKDRCWSSNTLGTWCKELSHWKRPWCWGRLRTRGDEVTEDELVGWRHWLNEHEFEQTLGNNEGQGSLVCCSPWSHKELTWLKDWPSTTTHMNEEGWRTFLLMYRLSIAAIESPKT